MCDNITKEEKEKYIKLTRLFEKYKDHKFNPFDKVLVYFQKRGNPNEFTVVPHVVWYYDSNELKHVLYDPTVRFTAGSLIPFNGNEEFIGFEGKNNIVDEIKSELSKQIEEPKTIYAVLGDYLQMEGKRMVKDYINMERNGLQINKKYVDDWFDKFKQKIVSLL